LQTKGAAHLLGVELVGAEVTHDIPISFALPNIPPSVLTDVSDVEFCVAFIE